MLEIADFLRLKKELEDRKSTQARLQGRKETLLQRLLDQYQCKDVPNAKKHLAKLEKSLQEKERIYSAKIAEFRDKYDAKLAS